MWVFMGHLLDKKERVVYTLSLDSNESLLPLLVEKELEPA